LQKQVRKVRSQNANGQIEKTEIEAIFVECIEDVRKEIMKRRLKNEVVSRKKGAATTKGAQKNAFQFPNEEEQASKEFEDSLMKLAAFAKGRIKYEDFTSKDKFNILDLFVNNEKTLVKIYEALFPHRAGAKGINLGPSVN
jgi:FAD/FMN-containing dehydrogenase